MACTLRFLYVPFLTDEVQYTVSLLTASQQKLADAVQNLTTVVDLLRQASLQQDDDVISYEKRTRKLSKRGVGVGIAAIIVAGVAIILSTVAVFLALHKSARERVQNNEPLQLHLPQSTTNAFQNN